MPETYFKVRWPNGQEQQCYSPSSVVGEYFEVNKCYSLQEFVDLSEQALNEASERVRQKFGYYCSSAADQLQQIRIIAQQFEPSDSVTLLAIQQG